MSSPMDVRKTRRLIGATGDGQRYKRSKAETTACDAHHEAQCAGLAVAICDAIKALPPDVLPTIRGVHLVGKHGSALVDEGEPIVKLKNMSLSCGDKTCVQWGGAVQISTC